MSKEELLDMNYFLNDDELDDNRTPKVVFPIK